MADVRELDERDVGVQLCHPAGAEARQPLGLAVVGGLLVSQLLTLYITPVYYVYIEGARLRFIRRRAKALTQSDTSQAPLPTGEPAL